MAEPQLNRYIEFLEALTPARLNELDQYVSGDVRFADPFHDVVGQRAMLAIFEHMFKSVQDLRFRASGRSISGDHGFFAWVLEGRLGKRPWRVSGVTEVVFNEEGRVCAHLDHWDAASQLYERFPLIGPLLRLLRLRIARPVRNGKHLGPPPASS